MRVEHFEWLRAHSVKYNLAGSGMAPIDVGELATLGGPGDLVGTLAELYGVDKPNILVTHGAQEGNFAALSALRVMGLAEYVVVPIPEYEPIRRLPAFLGLRSVEVSLGELPYSVRKGAVLFFSNPNNPTGRFMGKAMLRELSEELVKKGAYAVVDSIFMEFVEEDLRNLPLDNIAYTFSTSKFYTTRGFKVGWAIGDSKLVKAMGGVLDLVSPVIMDLEAGYASILLRNRGWVRERNLRIIRPNLEYARATLGRLGNVVEVEYREYMPITYVKLRCMGQAGSTVANELAKRGVLVTPGHLFGKDDGIRVSLGTLTGEEFKKAIGITAETIEELCT